MRTGPTVVAHALGAALLWRLDSLGGTDFDTAHGEVMKWLDPIAGLDERTENSSGSGVDPRRKRRFGQLVLRRRVGYGLAINSKYHRRSSARACQPRARHTRGASRRGRAIERACASCGPEMGHRRSPRHSTRRRSIVRRYHRAGSDLVLNCIARGGQLAWRKRKV